MILAKLLVIVAATSAMALGSTGVALADNAAGSGDVTNDWGSGDGANHTIRRGGTVASGNLVGVWQAVLWSYGGHPAADPFTDCDVDGQFGAKTERATMRVQGDEGLAADGVVGPATWGHFDDYNRLESSYVVHRVWTSTPKLYFHRGSTNEGGAYTWSWAGSSYRNTSHPTPDLVRVTSNCVYY